MSRTYALRLENERRTLATVHEIIDLPILRVGVQGVLAVPPVRDVAQQFIDIGLYFTVFAEQLMTVAQELRDEAGHRLPRALVGKSGLVGNAAVRELVNGAVRTSRILLKAGNEISEGGAALRSVHYRNDSYALHGLRNLLDFRIPDLARAAEPHRNPTPAGLADEVRRLANLATTFASQRRDAHLGLARILDELTALLNDLTGQAFLARLGPSPLPAIDELAIANAGTGDRFGPVLTANAAERAATRLAGMDGTQRERIERLLTAAQSSHERAYILKALSAGRQFEQLSVFAERIRGHDPAWLAEHLDPLGTGRGPLHDAGTGAPQATAWGDRYERSSPAHALIAAKVRGDPVSALQLTDPDLGGTFAERLAGAVDRGNVALDDGDQNRPGGVSDTSFEHVANRFIGPTFGKQFDGVAVTGPVPPDLMTRIESSVDNGIPVPVILGEARAAVYLGDDKMMALVVDRTGQMLQIQYPDGTVAWIPRNDFVGGIPGRQLYARHVFLPQ